MSRLSHPGWGLPKHQNGGALVSPTAGSRWSQRRGLGHHDGGAPVAPTEGARPPRWKSVVHPDGQVSVTTTEKYWAPRRRGTSHAVGGPSVVTTEAVRSRRGGGLSVTLTARDNVRGAPESRPSPILKRALYPDGAGRRGMATKHTPVGAKGGDERGGTATGPSQGLGPRTGGGRTIDSFSGWSRGPHARRRLPSWSGSGEKARLATPILVGSSGDISGWACRRFL